MAKEKNKNGIFDFSVFDFSVKNLITLTKREIANYFAGSYGYVVLSAFVILHLIIFLFVNRFLFLGRSDLSTYFNTLPFVLAFVMPALTMGAVTNDKKEGTIEYILTKPVSIFEYLLAKVLAAAKFVFLGLAVELPLILLILALGSFDYGIVLAQYLTTIFLVFAYASIGVFISTFTKNQVASYLTAFITFLVLILIGTPVIGIFLPASVSAILDRGSIFNQFISTLSGLITLANIIYFVGVSILAFVLSYFVLQVDKLSEDNPKLTTLKLISSILVLALVLSILFGQKIPGRLDLSSGQINSISNITKQTLRDLEEEVTLNVYYTENVPMQFRAVKNSMFDLVREMESVDSPNFSVVYKSTDNEGDRTEAESVGIQPIQFQEQTANSIGISQAYLGISIVVGDETQVVPSVLNTANLEYDIAKNIFKRTNTDQATVGILTEGQRLSTGATQFSSIARIRQSLEDQFEVVDIVRLKPGGEESESEENNDGIQIISQTVSGDDSNEGEENTEIPDGVEVVDEDIPDLGFVVPEEVDVILVPGSDSLSQKEVDQLKELYNNGVGLFVLSDSFTVNTNSEVLTASNQTSTLNNIFEDEGVTVETSIVYDLEQFQNVNIGFPVPLPYPPFAISNVVRDNELIRFDVPNVQLNWAGFISTDSDKFGDTTVVPILQTTQNAGFFDSSNADIDVRREWGQLSSSNLEQFTVGVALQKQLNEEASAKAVLVSDPEILSDFASVGAENQVFTANVIEWLSGSSSLSEISAKDRIAPPITTRIPLNFIDFGGSEEDMAALEAQVGGLLIQYILPALTILGVISAGFVMNMRRNKKMKRKFDL